MAGNDNSQMMLSNDFYRIEIAEYSNVGVFLDCFNQTGLNFCAGIVLVVEDAELRMSTFPMQIKFSVFFLVEVYSPFD